VCEKIQQHFQIFPGSVWTGYSAVVRTGPVGPRLTNQNQLTAEHNENVPIKKTNPQKRNKICRMKSHMAETVRY